MSSAMRLPDCRSDAVALAAMARRVMFAAVCAVAPLRMAKAGERRRLNGSRTFIGVVRASWGCSCAQDEKIGTNPLPLRLGLQVIRFCGYSQKDGGDSKATDQQCRRRKYVVPLIHKSVGLGREKDDR